MFAAKVLLYMSNDKPSDYKKRLSAELNNSVLRDEGALWAQMGGNDMGIDPMAMNMAGMAAADEANFGEPMYAGHGGQSGGPPSVHSAGSRFAPNPYHGGFDQVRPHLLHCS